MICRICGCDVTGEGSVACGSCRAPFHRDCWEFNGGCGIYGCGGRDATAWEGAPPEGGALEIREGTEPAFRVAPYVERLVRRLPRWGRAVVPSVTVGGVVGLLLALLAVLGGGARARDPMAEVLAICVVSSVVLALALTALADVTRRRPWVTLGSGLALVTACGLTIRQLGPYGGLGLVASYSTLLGFVAVAAAVVELVVGRRSFFRRRGAAASGLATGLTAMVVVWVEYVTFFLVIGWSPETGWPAWYSWSYVVDLAVTSLWIGVLGLVALAPPLTLARSPLMYRLKAEARREADEA